MCFLNTNVRTKKMVLIQNNKSPFRITEYNKWDSPAKQAVRNFLLRLGCQLSSDIEDYNADIKVIKPEVSYHEVEVKPGWVSDWPPSWDTIHIPYRKKRLIDMQDLPDRLTFYVLRKDLQKAWSIKASECINIVQVPNKFIPSGEYFFNIPVKNATLIDL